MTPDLMKAGAQARVEHELRVAASTGGKGGREASYGRVVQSADLSHSEGVVIDTSPEGVPVPRTATPNQNQPVKR